MNEITKLQVLMERLSEAWGIAYEFEKKGGENEKFFEDMEVKINSLIAEIVRHKRKIE